MVLAVHVDGASLGLPDTSGALDARGIWQLAVESFAIIGVNSFTMISGYFGIRLRWRGISVFLGQCLFYSVFVTAFMSIIIPEAVGPKQWFESWMILSHTDLWYVPAYFGLMLLSPFLNAGAESLSRRQFGASLALFVFFNVWCGWWWGGNFNPTGYTIVQLIMVYMLGRYIRLHMAQNVIRCRWAAMIYLSVSVLVALSYMWWPAKAFAYNSPLVLISSISFFMIFRGISFKSGIVNYVARSAFAVYLVHKNPLVWGNLLKPFVCDLWLSTDLWKFSMYAIVLMLSIYAVCIPMDMIRRRIIH